MQGLDRRDLHALTRPRGKSTLNYAVIYSKIIELARCLLRTLATVIEEQHALALAYGISHEFHSHHGLSGASRRYEQNSTSSAGDDRINSR
jgi:hypothetical protein